MKRIILVFFILLLSSVGFCQSYLGWITKKTNLYEGPGTDYNTLMSLKTGTQIFNISLNEENEFYNVIDLVTNTEGFVQKSKVKIGDVVYKNDQKIFTPSGKIHSYNPEVQIYNNTNLTLTLKLNDVNYTFSPQESQTLTLQPGSYEYRATAPGVVPNFGSEYLEKNEGYSWRFYLIKERR